MEGCADEANHVAHELVHSGGAAAERASVLKPGCRFSDDAADFADLEFCSLRQACTACGIGDEGDMIGAFGAVERAHQGGADVGTVGDEFADEIGFTHCVFHEARHTFGTALAGGRHAVERVGGLAESASGGCRDFFVPRVAVTGAGFDAGLEEGVDEVECAGEFGREGHLGDEVTKLEPLAVFGGVGVANEIKDVCARFLEGEIRAFDVHSEDARTGKRLRIDLVDGS